MSENPDKSVVRPDFSDKNAVKMLRDLASIAKRGDVRSVLVMTVDANGLCDWFTCFESEHHACLVALCMEDARNDVKGEIFNEALDSEGGIE